MMSLACEAEAWSLKPRNTTSVTRTNVSIIVANGIFPLRLDVKKFTSGAVQKVSGETQKRWFALKVFRSVIKLEYHASSTKKYDKVGYSTIM